MGMLSYISMRIYKKNKQKFSVKEFKDLENSFIKSPLYDKTGGFISRFTPIIFELT